MTQTLFPLGFAALTLLAASLARAGDDADRAEVARLDTAYQAAVKANDAATMDAILHPDMLLVTGTGKRFDKAAHLAEARNEERIYDHQEEIEGTQSVRVHGDTAVVTALLWIAGRERASGERFDYQLWFSDTYVRTPAGWKYWFGQAAQRLAPAS